MAPCTRSNARSSRNEQMRPALAVLGERQLVRLARRDLNRIPPLDLEGTRPLPASHAGDLQGIPPFLPPSERGAAVRSGRVCTGALP